MDYYKTLGVETTATDKEIKDAYRKLAKKYHPDTYEGDKKFAENKMKEINEAYDFLSKPENREKIVEEEETVVYAEEWQPRNPNESNYEEGTVYDFDKHFKGKTSANPFYNYDHYVDENDYTNMYYVDFNQIKNNVVHSLKRFIVKSFITFVILLIVIIIAFNMILGGLNNLFSKLNNVKPTGIGSIPVSSKEPEIPPEYQEYQKQLNEIQKFDFDEEYKKIQNQYSNFNLEDALKSFSDEHKDDIESIKGIFNTKLNGETGEDF
ncbi:MAG: DnaJ domain-containing protein [Clostridia bacterium]|nr:DnaJ domain-containing protein [Clostridia bacterium]